MAFTNQSARAARQIQLAMGMNLGRVSSPNSDPTPQLIQATKTAHARMRQINKAIKDELAKDQPDAQKVDRFSSAWSKWADKWREFTGIPLPGSKRPREDRSVKKRERLDPE